LLQTNANAGDKLRQVAFDKSVRRYLGSSLYADRIDRYQHDKGLTRRSFSFSEVGLADYFKGEAAEFKRYVLDSARYFRHPRPQ